MPGSHQHHPVGQGQRFFLIVGDGDGGDSGAVEDGGCTYLGDGGRCRLHAAGGPEAKPLGCRTYPLRFLDVGDAIRLVPRPECACVFAPSETRPLSATRGAELNPSTWVPRLGVRAVGPEDEVRPETLLAFLDALPPPGEDGAEHLEGLAWSLSREGLRGNPVPRAWPDEVVIARLIERAGRLASRRAELAVEDDFVGRAAGWIAAARPSPTDRPSRGEALAVRALLFAPPAGDLVTLLRETAARIRVARALPDESRDDPFAVAPVGVVEAIARGHGLS